MKTKIIPFDLEMAKKIQAGEIKGKMFVSDDTHNSVRIICTNRESAFGKIIALEKDKIGVEWVRECNIMGEFLANPLKIDEYATTRSIVLEIPDNEPQFKPFDKVLVRANNEMCWKPTFYVRTEITEDNKTFYETIGGIYHEQCIPYAGNEHLVGTTDNPE